MARGCIGVYPFFYTTTIYSHKSCRPGLQFETQNRRMYTAYLYIQYTVEECVSCLHGTAHKYKECAKSRVTSAIRLNVFRLQKVCHRHEYHRHDVDHHAPPHVRRQPLVQHERLGIVGGEVHDLDAPTGARGYRIGGARNIRRFCCLIKR